MLAAPRFRDDDIALIPCRPGVIVKAVRAFEGGGVSVHWTKPGVINGSGQMDGSRQFAVEALSVSAGNLEPPLAGERNRLLSVRAAKRD